LVACERLMQPRMGRNEPCLPSLVTARKRSPDPGVWVPIGAPSFPSYQTRTDRELASASVPPSKNAPFAADRGGPPNTDVASACAGTTTHSPAMPKQYARLWHS